MHTYSTDNEKRPRVYGYIALGAYFAASIVGAVLSLFSSILPVLAGIGVSWGVAFALLLNGYDKFLWKTWPAQRLGWTQVPDLNGRWEGYIETSYEGDIDEITLHQENDPNAEIQKLTASLDIKQTYRKINVHLLTENSSSDSDGATILTEDGKWPNLSYQYDNTPSTNSEDSMYRHYGTADLVLQETPDGTEVLEGPYYTDPDRESYGKMYFERVA